MKIFLIVSVLLSSTIAHAQSTPDWRPINRVYKQDAKVVGSVGSAGQIKAGHVLTTKSFPSSVLNNDKLAFWNLASASDNSGQTACTSGAAACDLTNNGTVTFTGSDLWGTGRAATLNGSTQYFTNTDSFFDFGSTIDWAIGGWFYSTNWVPSSANQVLLLQGDQNTDASYRIVLIQTTGVLSLQATNTSTSYDAAASTAGTLAAGWHHIAGTYNSTADLLTLYVDGSAVSQAPIATIRASTTDRFYLGATLASGSPTYHFPGVVQDVFAVRGYAVTAQDIRRLYSTRIDHNKNLIAKRQDWHFKHQHLGTAGNPYQTLPFVWHDPTDANSLFVDFSDLDATDKVDIRLYDLQQ